MGKLEKELRDKILRISAASDPDTIPPTHVSEPIDLLRRLVDIRTSEDIFRSDELFASDEDLLSAANSCIRALYFSTPLQAGHRILLTYLYHWSDDLFKISLADYDEDEATATTIVNNFQFVGDVLTDLEDTNGNVIGKIFASVSGYSGAVYQADMAAVRMPYCNEICWNLNQAKMLDTKISTLAAKQGLLEADLDALGPKLGEPQAIPLGGYQQRIDLSVGIGNTVSLTPVSSSYSYSIADIAEGDTLIISGTGASVPRLWGIIDSQNKLLAVADANATATNLRMTAPQNAAKLIINDNSGSTSYVISAADKKVVLISDIVNSISEGGDNVPASASLTKQLGQDLMNLYAIAGALADTTTLTWAADANRTSVEYNFVKGRKYALLFSFSGFAANDASQFYALYGRKGAIVKMTWSRNNYNPFTSPLIFVAEEDMDSIDIYFASLFTASSSKIITMKVATIVSSGSQDEGGGEGGDETTDDEIIRMITGLYHRESFKSGADGVSFDLTFDTPTSSFILRVDQIVGSTEKFLIQQIDTSDVATNYKVNQSLDTDIPVSIAPATYPKMRIYAGKSYGTPTYTQEQTNFVLSLMTNDKGVDGRIADTNKDVKNIGDTITTYDGVSFKKSYNAVSGSGISYSDFNIVYPSKQNDILKIDLRARTLANVSLYYKATSSSSWTSTGSYVRTDRSLYIKLDSDVYAYGFYTQASNVTATEQIEVSIIALNKYGMFRQANPLMGKNIVMFGDSITQLPNTGSTRGYGIPELLAFMTGANVYRVAIGGTKLARSSAELPASVESHDDASKCYQICSLVEGLVTGNLTRQAQAISEYLGDSFTADVTLPIMQALDLDKIDIITIFGGTNDCTSGVQLGSASDTTPTTIYGAINYMVNLIHTNFPKIKIFIFTPIPRQFDKNDATTWSDGYTPHSGGILLPQYAETIAAAAKKNHIPVCDLYWGMGWNKYNFHAFCASNDLTHPRFGFDKLAEKMAAFIKANI